MLTEAATPGYIIRSCFGILQSARLLGEEGGVVCPWLLRGGSLHFCWSLRLWWHLATTLLTTAGGAAITTENTLYIHIWVVVKLMVPFFRIPIFTAPNMSWYPKKGHNLDIHPYICFRTCQVIGTTPSFLPLIHYTSVQGLGLVGGRSKVF